MDEEFLFNLFFLIIAIIFLFTQVIYKISKKDLDLVKRGIQNRPSNTLMLLTNSYRMDEIRLNGEPLIFTDKITYLDVQIGDVFGWKNSNLSSHAFKITENEFEQDTVVVPVISKYGCSYKSEIPQAFINRMETCKNIEKVLLACSIFVLIITAINVSYNYYTNQIDELKSGMYEQTYIDYEKKLHDNCDQEDVTKCSQYEGIYPASEYTVGQDIEPGLYYIIESGSISGYEINQEIEFASDYELVELVDGDELVLFSKNLLISQDAFKPTSIDGYHSEGEYVVGLNIEPGTYKIIGSMYTGYYLGATRPNDADFTEITNNPIGFETIELKDGDYFYLKDAIMKKK